MHFILYYFCASPLLRPVPLSISKFWFLEFIITGKWARGIPITVEIPEISPCTLDVQSSLLLISFICCMSLKFSQGSHWDYSHFLNISDKSKHCCFCFIEDPIFLQSPFVSLLKSPLEKGSVIAVVCKWGIADSMEEMATALAKHVYLLLWNDSHICSSHHAASSRMPDSNYVVVAHRHICVCSLQGHAGFL